ncbi:MAG: glutaredoxin 3 [Alphaproteobacteria bacterium]|nr:glutaredoxin 3 [Alphaproteobacteria bacterium]MBU0796161.1 glutaredoxin 3 [Alphaproteobacteria bacterium]MBU0888036.1 glutaredoxin 3 [Alphaproteobacteria bacterium]MBU1813005.1 glutaredoxin 3 [Alphaproteobacteria bacterium]
MAEIVIYSTLMCPYCHAAKQLLTQKGVAFEEIDVTFNSGKRSEMREKAGGRTSVPQIFIDGTHIGGSDDLHDLDRAGKLDPMLQGTA